MDEDFKGREVLLQLGKIPSGLLDSGGMMKRVDEKPADSTDGHTGTDGGDCDVEKTAQRRCVGGGTGEPLLHRDRKIAGSPKGGETGQQVCNK